MSDAWKGELELNDIFNEKHSSTGDPWGASGGALVGAGCVTALIAGGVIALPAMPAIATGVAVGGAIVAGAAVGAAVGAHLKKPIEDLFKQSAAEVEKNFPGFNLPFGKIKFPPLGNGIALTGAGLLQNARGQDAGRRGSWTNFMENDYRPSWMR